MAETGVKYFNHIFKINEEGEFGFSPELGVSISTNTFIGRDICIGLKIGIKSKNEWKVISTKPAKIKTVYREYVSYINDREITLLNLLESKNHVFQTFNSFDIDNEKVFKLNDNEKTYLRYVEKLIEHKKDDMFFVIPVIHFLGQSEYKSNLYPVLYELKDKTLQNFVFLFKKFTENNIYNINPDGIIVDSGEVYKKDSKVISEAVDLWINGFDQYSFNLKTKDEVKNSLKFVAEKILDILTINT